VYYHRMKFKEYRWQQRWEWRWEEYNPECGDIYRCGENRLTGNFAWKSALAIYLPPLDAGAMKRMRTQHKLVILISFLFFSDGVTFGFGLADE